MVPPPRNGSGARRIKKALTLPFLDLLLWLAGYSIRRRFSINFPRGADWENRYESRILDRRSAIVGGYGPSFGR
jgi:hypothetical protein